jgi:hypothetical protein
VATSVGVGVTGGLGAAQPTNETSMRIHIPKIAGLRSMVTPLTGEAT